MDASATPVWIDTDCSIGSPLREVDDAFAIALAFHFPNAQISGISTTYGNASLRATTAATKDLVARLSVECGISPPVFAGASSRNDLGVETAATRALADTLRTRRDLVYVSLGPLTNLATLQILHPDLTAHIRRVVFLGGTSEATLVRLGSRHAVQIHDANVIKDPEAVRRVLRTRLSITLIPITTAAPLTLNADDLRRIGEANGSGNFLRAKSRVWFWFWRNFVGTDGGPIFDAAAILAAVQPAQTPLQKLSAHLDGRGNLIFSADSARRVFVCEKLAPSAHRVVIENLTR
ncbi:MAG: nucleoside hydrolase [Verrucomicrobiota bacterium]|nr:nucleoside hydrolase [Verrucomicrobiota bacterium]